MRKQRLVRGDVGAWVFKGNPDEVWDYFAALERAGTVPGRLEEGGWTVGRNYRTDLIQAGDLMVLWITGTKNPGIYEIGRVTGPASEDEVIDERFLIDPSPGRRPDACGAV